MLDKEHLWVTSGCKDPYIEPIRWEIIDWDQRRTFSVTLNGDVDSDPLAIEHLQRHIDSLGPDVCAIEVSNDGELVTVSSNPDHDETSCAHFPRLRDLQYPGIPTVPRTELRELDRIVPNVDLVSYRRRKAVFKYYFHAKLLHHQRWDELNILMRLSSHPNIVPFHRVVVEKLYGQEHIVGFTTQYITGGTLNANHDNTGDRRIFKLKWLKQLIRVVDDLNYKYGIQHQDIAPRNMVVHEATDKLMLFDFNVSAQIGAPFDDLRGETFYEYRNDVKGVIFTLYEIITRDDHFRLVPHHLQDASAVLNMQDWVKHPDVRLDNPLTKYRAVLDEWVLRRKQRGDLGIFTEASHYIDWPKLPSHPRSGQSEDEHGQVYRNWFIQRREARAKNLQVIKWQRPAQGKIKEGMCVFADGTVINTSIEA